MIAADLALIEPSTEQFARDVCIHVDDGRITKIDQNKATGNGLLAMPAMANAHDHGFGIRPLAYGSGDDSLECWIPGLAARPTSDPQLETEVAFARMALAGIGSTMHCHNSLLTYRLMAEATAVSAAAAKVGIRVGFACPVLDDNTWNYGGPELLRKQLGESAFRELSNRKPPVLPGHEQVAQVNAIAAELDRPGFTVQFGPIGPQWCKMKTLEAIAEASVNSNRRVHMHLLESKWQREYLDKTHPKGIIELLDSIGLLSPRLTVAHCVWITDKECELLAERGVTVVTNAACNLRLRSGISPVAKLANFGVNTAVGLDGISLNDNQDYMADLRLTRLLGNGTELENHLEAGLFLHNIFDASFMTICAQKGYGTLGQDAHADIVLLNYATMANDILVDNDKRIFDLVFGRMATNFVHDLYVAGKKIVNDKKLVAFDFDHAQAELLAQAKKNIGSNYVLLELISKQKEAIRTVLSNPDN